LSVLQELADNKKVTQINKEILIENGLASKNDLIKILGNGELKAKLEVTANGFTKTAQAAIEAQGGTATKI
jgi:large subunit ribosomal protein L15